MDDKLKIFWKLDVLVKMSRSKNDGPALHIEENELKEKIASYKQEIDEIKLITDEEMYDTSAEMADRNIEIITKKHLQNLRNELKEHNKKLAELKDEEKKLYAATSLLRENISSQEKYIVSMQERIGEVIDYEVIDHYNILIAETTEKVVLLKDELEERNTNYNQVQDNIAALSERIAATEDKIEKKKRLLEETQASLENKDNYIDKSKKDKSNKKIAELEGKIEKINKRLEEIKGDPKYLETEIKSVINSKKDISLARPFLVELINKVIAIPYINVPMNNELEQELLRATQARDSFANEMDQKKYNLLETNTPEKIRIDYLNNRIENWNKDLKYLEEKIAKIDKDEEYNYDAKNKQLAQLLERINKETNEYEKAYQDTPDTSISLKASLKAGLDEKLEDLKQAEKIMTSFKLDESEDIKIATSLAKCEINDINKKIEKANAEILEIKNRLTSKKSGLIDISSRNKDKDILKELAQIVINIKHRRQFPETPMNLISNLEEELGLELMSSINVGLIESTSTLVPIDFDNYMKPKEYESKETANEAKEPVEDIEPKRGIKVVEESNVPEERVEETPTETVKEEEEAPATEELDESDDDLLDIEGIINQEPEKEETQVVEEKPVEEVITEAPKTDEITPVIEEQEELSLDNMYSNQKAEPVINEDNEEKNTWLESELSEYIDNLKSQDE